MSDLPDDDTIMDELRDFLHQQGDDPEAAGRALAAMVRSWATGYAAAVRRQQRRASIRLVPPHPANKKGRSK